MGSLPPTMGAKMGYKVKISSPKGVLSNVSVGDAMDKIVSLTAGTPDQGGQKTGDPNASGGL